MVMISALNATQQSSYFQKPVNNKVSFAGINNNLQQDTVSFNGAIDSAGNALKTKGGKIGLLGAALLLLGGLVAAPKALAHRVYINGTEVQHVHKVPANTSFEFSVGSGGWALRTYTTEQSVVHPGMQEYQKVPGGWVPVTRVYDSHNNLQYFQEGRKIPGRTPVVIVPPTMPDWAREQIRIIPHGSTIIVPAPGHHHFPPGGHHHHHHHR
ncbi:MAG: hypothetical protein AB1782_16095 [Cyanobacteriota bacterium]